MNIAEAKAKLSALVEAALRGEDVILARGGKPVARITPVEAVPAWRPRHLLKELRLKEGGAVDVPEDAFDPDPADAAAADAPLDPSERLR